jgi:large subunit ribosomal protein L10
MPNAKVLSEKQAIVEALTERLQGASAGIVIDYKGITVAEDTQLRANMRKEEVEYSVVKNTLLRFAAKNVGLDDLDSVLNGTTALAISMEDSIAPARVISEFIKKNPKVPFEIKAGFVDGQVVDVETIKALGELPGKDVLVAMVLGTMNAPIAALARAIKAIAEQQGAPAGEAAEEAAPAAE